MKQPNNSISITPEHPVFWVEVQDNTNGYYVCIAEGRTKKATLKASIKRLKRLTRDAEKKLKELEGEA